MNSAAFIDRDGVILVEHSGTYLNSITEMEFIPGSVNAVVSLSKIFDKVIIITNQAGIGYGTVKRKDVMDIHAEINKAIFSAGGRIDGIYFCPHKKEANCDCRKPKTGMVEAAATLHNIDLKRSILIGDRASDIECALLSEIFPILVLSGYGKNALLELNEKGYGTPDIFNIYADLAAVGKYIEKRLNDNATSSTSEKS